MVRAMGVTCLKRLLIGPSALARGRTLTVVVLSRRRCSTKRVINVQLEDAHFLVAVDLSDHSPSPVFLRSLPPPGPLLR